MFLYKKKLIVIFLLLLATFSFSFTTTVYAKQQRTIKEKYELKTVITPQKAKECPNNNSLLGNPDCENSVAWLIQEVLNLIKVFGPIIMIVLSSVDFIQVIVSGDDQAMKKAQNKLIIRVLLSILLFFLPLLVKFLLSIFGLTSSGISDLS